MNEIKVSVIIPVYNQQKYIRTCICSVQEQTLKDIEIICIDDASTDGTGEIIKEIMLNDSRIRCLKNKYNLGPGPSRNLGLDMAVGKYLIFLDSDDYFERNMLEITYCLAEKYHTDMVIFSEMMVQGEYIHPYKYEMEFLCRGLTHRVFNYKDIPSLIFNIWAGWTWDKLLNTAFVKVNGLRFPDLRNSEDLSFAFAAMVKAERIALCENNFVYHRLGISTSVSATQNKNFECSLEAHTILKEELKRMGIFNEIAQSFLNEAVAILVFFYRGMKGVDKENYYEYLKKVCFPSLGFLQHPSNYYYNQVHYRLCWDLMHSRNLDEFERLNPLETCFSATSVYEANRYKLAEIVVYIKAMERELVIWGAGKLGYGLVNVCEKEGLKVDFIVDSDQNKIGTRIGNLTVLSFSGIYDRRLFILVPNARYFEEVCSQVEYMSKGQMLFNLQVYLNYPFSIEECCVVV